jgi:hypothetical protein
MSSLSSASIYKLSVKQAEGIRRYIQKDTNLNIDFIQDYKFL